MQPSKSWRLVRQVIVGLSFALLLMPTVSGPAAAQEVGWSQPVLVFEGQGTVFFPSISADIYGQIHAFWRFNPDPATGLSGYQLYYARLDRPDWPPLDIYVTDGNLSSLYSVVNHNRVGLLWNGGLFMHSQMGADMSVRAWSAPQELSRAYANSSLIAAPDQSIWLVYGDSSTNAIFVRRQDPETHMWDAPQFVANSSSPGAAPDAPRLTFSSDGTMHAVWSEYQLPNGWPPLGLYYARSVDGGLNWSAPLAMADGRYNQPNIVSGLRQNVYAAWTGIAGVGGKYFMQSTDGGRTWSGVTALLPPGSGGGSEGAPNMVVDGSGKLHILFSNNNCVYYASLESSGWTDPDCISRGIPSSHTEFPVMTLGLGNRLHVLWWANDRQVWYTSRVLPVPHQEPLPTPTRVIETPIPPTEPPTPVPSPTPLPDYGMPMDPALTTQSGMWATIGGVLPVVILVLIVLLARRYR